MSPIHRPPIPGPYTQAAHASPLYAVRVRGARACFTRPECKVERRSYDVMTPSAARAVIESVLWKPAIQWVVRAIHVLSPVRWQSCRRNELSQRLGERGAPLSIEDVHTQRTTVLLRHVDYVVECYFRMTPVALLDPDRNNNVLKYDAMWRRRLGNHQQHRQPYLGCREFPAELSEFDLSTLPHVRTGTRDLGRMFFDFDYAGCPGEGRKMPMFFDAALVDNCVHVPTPEEVRTAERRLVACS